jgi:hypothetical protein
MRNHILLNLMLILGLANLCSALNPQSPSAPPPASQDQSSSPKQSATTQDPTADSDAGEGLGTTEQVARDVLGNLQQGLESRDIKQVLGVFDQHGMSNYSELRDQLTAFFRRYDTIAFRYQVLQATTDKGLGFATADIDMDAVTADGSQVPVRRTLQMRFQIRLTAKGWKVLAFKPADFFAQ